MKKKNKVKELNYDFWARKYEPNTLREFFLMSAVRQIFTAYRKDPSQRKIKITKYDICSLQDASAIVSDFIGDLRLMAISPKGNADNRIQLFSDVTVDGDEVTFIINEELMNYDIFNDFIEDIVFKE